MLRDWRLYLADVVEYSDRALTYADGLTYEQLMGDQRTYEAVCRCLEISGEAVKKLPPDVRARAPEVAWHRGAGFRDRLAHGYFSLDPDVVWRVISNDLRPLRDRAAELLAAADADAAS